MMPTVSILSVLYSSSTPTFSLTSSSLSFIYSAPETWNTPLPSPTLVSEFSNIVPTHPLDNLLHLAPKPVSLGSLM